MKQSVGSVEKIVGVKGTPIVACSLIQKIHPDTRSWPTVTDEIILIWRFNKNICPHYPVFICCPINLEAFLIHVVRILIFYMWVCNYYESTIRDVYN
jgi:hypothetical protein